MHRFVPLLGLLAVTPLGFSSSDDEGFLSQFLRESKGRIVNGYDAKKNQFPFMASLHNSDDGEVICGGNIISKLFVVTAAHCVVIQASLAQNGDKIKIVVKVGKHKVTEKESTEQVRVVDKIYIHPNYSGSKLTFDIALVKLNETLAFNRVVKPAMLPPPGTVPKGDVTIAGWGYMLAPKYVSPDILQTTTLPVVTNKRCKRILDSLSTIQLSQYLIENNFCGTSTGIGPEACFGDSGGPAVQQNSRKGRHTLVGVVSWGLKICGIPNAPSIFVRISAFVEWIDKIVKYG